MKHLKKHLASYLLLCILCAAFFLRSVQLSTVPNGFHADEASFLLNAVTILQTGRDEDNRFLPVVLTSLIDPKPAAYSYLQIPFIALFGPTVFAARIPAVILGVLSIYLVFLILKRVGYQTLGICVAAVLAISPWHIVISRATQEVVLALTATLAAIVCFIAYWKNQKIQTAFWLLFFSFFALYNYHSAKIFLPSLFIVWSLFLYISQKLPKKFFITIGAICIVALCASFLIQESTSRFSAVGILSNIEPQISINEQITAATPLAPQVLLRTFYNKPVTYATSALQEYMHYFSADFLFFSGGEPKRYFIPFHGLLYLFEIPLLLAGCILALRKKHKLFWFVFTAALLAPLPAALTYQETPSMIRTVPLLIALSFFIGYALEQLLQKPERIKIGVTLVLLPVVIWQLSYFWMQLSVQQKVYRPWHRNTPYTAIAQKLTTIEPNYTTIRVVNDLRPLYAYFALEYLIPLNTLQSHPFERQKEQARLGKYEFTRGNCDFGTLNDQTLYVAETECRRSFTHSGNLHVIDTITYDDGTAVYEFLTYSKE
ncbi:glycosyltransferase family 39 protein [Candidatus Woesebacteria bacterium]|nr:glycosyltransferase family 39 protein [Candidatus Woesebacteria bacterium]